MLPDKALRQKLSHLSRACSLSLSLSLSFSLFLCLGKSRKECVLQEERGVLVAFRRVWGGDNIKKNVVPRRASQGMDQLPQLNYIMAGRWAVKP